MVWEKNVKTIVMIEMQGEEVSRARQEVPLTTEETSSSLIYMMFLCNQSEPKHEYVQYTIVLFL